MGTSKTRSGRNIPKAVPTVSPNVPASIKAVRPSPVQSRPSTHMAISWRKLIFIAAPGAPAASTENVPRVWLKAFRPAEVWRATKCLLAASSISYSLGLRHTCHDIFRSPRCRNLAGVCTQDGLSIQGRFPL
jgi:hypothetical protein